MGAVIAAAVIAAGGAAYAANQQSKAAKEANATMNQAQGVEYEKLPFPQLVDYKQAGINSIGANLRNLPANFDLANQVNRFNVGQAVRGYSTIQPYYKQLQQQIGKNALSFARGELPSDVVSSMGRAAAQRGLSSGFGQGAGGAGAGTALGNLNLRNLGLTSLQLSQQGTELGMRVNQAAAGMTPGLFDLTSQFMTPGMALGAMGQNASIINDWNKINAGIMNDQNTQNTSLQNSLLQMNAESSLAQGTARAGQYASAANTLSGLVTALAQRNQNSGFYGTASAAQGALGSNPYGATVTPSEYGYAVRPQVL